MKIKISMISKATVNDLLDFYVNVGVNILKQYDRKCVMGIGLSMEEFNDFDNQVIVLRKTMVKTLKRSIKIDKITYLSNKQFYSLSEPSLNSI